MKRYYTDNLSPGPVADDEEVHCVYVRADLQSHARDLLAVAERMEHSELCPANYCIKPAITGDECCQIERAHRRIPDHAFQGGECNCALGELQSTLAP